MGINAETVSSNWHWDMIGPDLVVAGTTGVAVGLVLLGAQAFTTQRRNRADSQFAWESLKPKIYGAIAPNWLKSLTHLTPMPPALIALDELAAGEPLTLWQSHLKKPDRTLTLLSFVLRQRPIFEAHANEVEQITTIVFNQRGMTDSESDYWRQRVFARAHALEDSELQAMSRLFANRDLSVDWDDFIGLVTEPRLGEALRSYRASSAMYESSIAALKELAVEDMRRELERAGPLQPVL